ncbi:MAG: phosphoribosyltransferase family protein, partial [Candidatus Gracilibacteria bacterium]|nr:phosphoribosyltransferase family protein [Candidatus Gracilibacteria bacterium]
QSYLNIHKHIAKIQNECGLIDAKMAFGQDTEEVYLDDIYYADQYKWMDFGRGKLAEMTFYGKQSQNKMLISESIDEIIGKIECLIGKEKYTAIAITPWSIDRKNQLLKILKSRLKDLGLPFVSIIKYYPSGIPIPQKSLKTREQRIQNARNTIFVDDKNIAHYNAILLIDDFVGSGSTLNETAKKLKQLGVKKVDGFAFVGNLNLSYDVINEI